MLYITLHKLFWELSQKRRNDNINTICVLEGPGRGNIEGTLCKITVFAREVPYDNKIWTKLRFLLPDILFP